MKFRIVRTSEHVDEKRPCDGAKVAEDEDGDVYWWLEINTLEELMEFIDKHGTLVLQRFSKITRIEIYDDYRE